MTSGTPTAYAVSPDSGEHWTAEGAWPAAPGVHRIPLPLPTDGLRAVNVYAIEVDDGLVLVDGGWAIEVARDRLERSLRSIGSGFGDIRRFLVTHVHRDHYTMAVVLGRELGVDVTLGRAEEPALEYLNRRGADGGGLGSPFARALVATGAPELAEAWGTVSEDARLDLAMWAYPDQWLEGDTRVAVGARTLDAVHTPGHTPGHYVFADRPAGLLFAGDHVLPTITPSIGFSAPQADLPLGDFLASLTKVRALPDLRLLPAHGPVAASTHTRVDELAAHHDVRLGQCAKALAGSATGLTAVEVARTLGWTRREHAFDDLDVFNRGLAALETKAHLDLLVARGEAVRSEHADEALRYAPDGGG